MDPVRNPFAPGAGSPPPELAGRDDVIRDADTALQRVLKKRHAQSQMLLGLRGTGKTVLLNKIREMAEDHGHQTSYIEAPEEESLVELIYPKVHQVLRKLSLVESAKASTYSAMRTLRAFASSFDIKFGDFSISVDPEPGSADSGLLEYDLADLFDRVGQAANEAGTCWTLLVDEVQYLTGDELGALIVALHRTNQRQLPVLLFGAGLPQVAALSGDAKSYAERLFSYPTIGPLDDKAATEAIREPVEEEGEEISDEAIEMIIDHTKGYAYFLQEWGYQTWNEASMSPINAQDAAAASKAALKRLDEGFFRVRFDRLTPKEREYVIAMAYMGPGPHRSGDIADALEEDVRALGPRRAAIIRKGMIYSPAHGDVAFTVPMFDEYIKRTLPNLG